MTTLSARVSWPSRRPGRPSRLTRRRLGREPLEARALLAAAPVISEFMAANTSTLQDQDGDYSDWIEVLNAGDQPVDLNGYWLTDRANDLTGWRFPSHLLQPGQMVLVFASGKDRDLAGSELHTNFRLANEGEYLALVAPDGQTVVQQFAPEYPPQVADVAYGVAPDQLSETLLAAGGAAKYLVPQDDSQRNEWHQEGFDDAAWPSGPTGIGYETGGAEEPPMTAAIQSLGPIGYWRFEETGGAATAQNLGSIGVSLSGTYVGDADRDAAGPGSSQALYGFDDTNSAVSFDGINDGVTTSAFPLNGLPAFSMVGMIRPDQQTGDRAGLFGQNDAVEFGFINPTTLQVWTPGGGSINVDYTLPLNEWHHVAVVGDGQSLKIYLDGELAGQGGSVTANYGSSNSPLNIGGGGIFDATGNYFRGDVDEVAVFDRALSDQEIGSLLGGQGGGGTNLTGLVATDVQAGMFNQASSLYVRIPFQVDDPAKYNQLLLNLQYDDGVVAYVNGVEVLRENVPGEDDEPLAYNAAATNSRPDSQVVEPVVLDISDARGSLHAGQNLLALHVLNLSAGDPDLLVRPELLGGLASVDVSTFGYLTTPTPGDANVPVAADLGPLVVSSQHSPDAPLPNQAVTVTANVVPTLRDVANVQLVYRVMFGPETTVAMRDDGTAPDQTAGDSVYSATIPAQIAQPGEMLNWYVQAFDTNQAAGRLPKFEVKTGRNRSPEYLGTLVRDASISSEIDVFHWWVENASAAGSRNGTHASLYYNGQFYNNVFVRQRGGSTANNPVGKTNFKFDFVGEQFVFDARYKPVEEFNLNSTATDKAYIRQPLAFETYAAVGAPASISFPMHVRRNGEFYGVFAFIEEPDDEMLERNGLDDKGALYKIYNEFTSASGARKKTREHENNSDLADFVRQVNQLEGIPLRNYLFDNVNLPATLNYLVATVLTHQNDNPHKNHFLYRDSDGSGEWMFLPWDHDLTWGSNWVGTSFSDVIYADADNITFGPVPGHDPSVIHPSHPLINSEPYREWNNHWNRLMDALLQDDVIQTMFLRRLRTAMDELFGPPGTTDSFVDRRLNEFLATMGPDTALDTQQWANPRWRWGEDQSFAEAVEIIRNEYLEVRRQHLYVTHGVDNLDPGEITVLVPEFTEARYFVPSNDSLGTTWTEPSFNDTAWATGETGIGFENNPRTFDPFIRTRVKPTETAADGTSVFLRIPFDVANPAQIENLTLRMKIDDGFVAYLNGQEVARARLRTEETPGYDDRALAHANTAAISFENFLINDHLDALVAGRNVLAIHALNSSTTSSDMLILPELIDGVVQTVEIAGIPHGQIGNPAIAFDGQDFDVSPVSGNQDEEYLRLNNPSAEAVDISGWRLSGGIEHTFRKGTVIPAGMSLYVSPNVATFRARATGPSGGQGLLVQGNYQGHLSNLGDVVYLQGADGAPVDTLSIPANPTVAQQYLRVTELHYNPISLDDETEFIELTNISNSETLDVGGVTLSAGPQEPYSLPDGTQLAPGQSLVIVKDVAAFQAAYPGVPAGSMFGPLVGNFSNQGERIKLDDALGNTIVDFQYRDDSVWPAAADGAGASLELSDPATPVEQLGKYYHWRHSRAAGGTPAAPAQDPLGVVINEIVSNPAAGQSDAVELLNRSTSSVDLSGWSLTDTPSNYRKYLFPAGTTLAPGQYLTIGAQQLGFGFTGTSDDDAWLVRADAGGQPTQFGDQVSFGASVLGESWGRFPNATGRLGTMIASTLGAANSNPRVGQVVISEVQYHPADPSGAALALEPTIEPDDLEFVELTNVAGTPLDMIGWQISGGVDMIFSESVSLAPGQSLIVVSFDPAAAANESLLAAFRAHYDLDPTVVIRGGDIGRLGNSYDRIALLRPGGTEQDPDASEPLMVDEVLYDDLAPWPLAADGTGASLQRVAGTSYGNLAASWYAATPTPGQPSFGGPRGDFNNDGLVDEIDINLLFAQIRAAVPDMEFDLTGDAMVDEVDRDELILNVLGTTFGDANLDGIFNSSDLVNVFAIGKYEDNTPLNAGWSDGDWNADGDFGTGDLVLAFQQGGYTAASEPAVSSALSAHQQTWAAALAWLPAPADQQLAERGTIDIKQHDELRRADVRRWLNVNDRAVQSLFTDESTATATLADRPMLEDDLLEALLVERSRLAARDDPAA